MPPAVKLCGAELPRLAKRGLQEAMFFATVRATLGSLESLEQIDANPVKHNASRPAQGAHFVGLARDVFDNPMFSVLVKNIAFGHRPFPWSDVVTRIVEGDGLGYQHVLSVSAAATASNASKRVGILSRPL
jgi:hypothetical protein